MAEIYGFFNDNNGDRTYLDDQMAAPFGALAGGAGVSPFVGDKLLPAIGTGLQIKIASGFAFGGILPGWWYRATDEVVKTLDVALEGKQRIDTVVVRFDRNTEARTATIQVIKGDEVTAEPVAKALTQNEMVYELSLCEVLIDETGIQSLTDTRVMIPVSGRDVLTADRTYYVSNDGDDNNSGLETSSPFKTIQHAINVVSKLDLNGYTVHIDLWTANDAAVIYDLTQRLVLKDPVGEGTVVMRGDKDNQNNVTLEAGNFHCIYATESRKYFLRDFKCEGNTTAYGVIVDEGSQVTVDGINFRDLYSAMVTTGGAIRLTKTNHDIKFAGEFTNMLVAVQNGKFFGYGINFVTTAVTEFIYFANITEASFMHLAGTSYTKTNIAGTKYIVSTNAVLKLSGAVLPGNTGGITHSGGQVV